MCYKDSYQDLQNPIFLKNVFPGTQQSGDNVDISHMTKQLILDKLQGLSSLIALADSIGPGTIAAN